jgi:choline dehydrogenase-like flavoprotein
MEIPFAALADLNDVDYCIIGSGPAGITCARELASKNRKVLLLEGGGRMWSQDSQSLYDGETIGDRYFDLQDARLRYFGGSSNHWTGWCRPLDAHDFEGKGPARIGRWPIRRSDLDPYLPRAMNILEIEPPAADIPLEGGTLRKIDVSFSPPVRFAEKYQGEIAGSERIILCLNCNLTRMEVAGGAISSVTVRNYEGARADIKARTFILACGGIENSRLLLWCNVASGGALLKEQADLAGRYWFEHHHAAIGDAIVETGFVARRTDPNAPSGESMTLLALTPEMIAETGILSCSLRLLPTTGGQAKALVEDVACVAPTWANWAVEALWDGKLCAHSLKATAEQEPRFDNRVALGEAVDRFGIPKLRLHWRRSELDLRTLREAAKALGFYLAVQDIGRVRLAPWVLGEAPYPTDVEIAAYHHMGGTRMSDDPKAGVVDRNCRLFGMANLYVIGSSVFPSGGHGTPTLTITQLALRLADHLGTEEARRLDIHMSIAPAEAPSQ